MVAKPRTCVVLRRAAWRVVVDGVGEADAGVFEALCLCLW